jgi:hypothetical protein
MQRREDKRRPIKLLSPYPPPKFGGNREKADRIVIIVSLDKIVEKICPLLKKHSVL